ncbi:hypothetical protein ACA910_018676 [Epithemia clementina (nom. ined.)]
MDATQRLNDYIFYRGTAKLHEVLQLMFCLHEILIKGQTFIHVIWIAGRRMIYQGTNVLSWSDFTSGVMSGINMLHYIPLHKTALERQGKPICSLLQYIVQDEVPLFYLEPSQWFEQAQDCDGHYVWTPAPWLGDVAVYQMAEAQHIQPWNVHIFIIPSDMGGWWRKTLYKTSNSFALFLLMMHFGPNPPSMNLSP